MTTEAYIVVIAEQGGTRTVDRHALNVPVELARGQYEDLSDLAVREFIKDMTAERDRRKAVTENRRAIAQRTGGWSPFDAMKGS